MFFSRLDIYVVSVPTGFTSIHVISADVANRTRRITMRISLNELLSSIFAKAYENIGNPTFNIPDATVLVE